MHVYHVNLLSRLRKMSKIKFKNDNTRNVNQKCRRFRDLDDIILDNDVNDYENVDFAFITDTDATS